VCGAHSGAVRAVRAKCAGKESVRRRVRAVAEKAEARSARQSVIQGVLFAFISPLYILRLHVISRLISIRAPRCAEMMRDGEFSVC